MHATMLPVLSLDTIHDLYPRYSRVWDVLLDEASARHLLTLEEFTEEMRDPRLEKYVVLDEADSIVAMTTIATDLEAIPWIHPTFYRHRYPEEAASGRLFYLGYLFVDNEHRRSPALSLMAEAVNARLVAARGVIGFDICNYNMEKGIGRRFRRLLASSRAIVRADTQTYFLADFRDPAPDSGNAFYEVRSAAERPDLVDDVHALLADRWPAFTLVGHASHGLDLEAELARYPSHQLLLVDRHQALCGVALSLPIAWDGTEDGLPSGWDDAIASSAEQRQRDQAPNSLLLLSITFAAEHTGAGRSTLLLEALKQHAAEVGFRSVIGPVRPTLKSTYPLIAFEDYLRWTLPDGEPFDPWLRLHRRLGAETLGVAAESMVVTGTVAEWESWVGQSMPGSGAYVIDGGQVPLQVDRQADLGRYCEPNLWVRYAISP